MLVVREIFWIRKLKTQLYSDLIKNVANEKDFHAAAFPSISTRLKQQNGDDITNDIIMKQNIFDVM